MRMIGDSRMREISTWKRRGRRLTRSWRGAGVIAAVAVGMLGGVFPATPAGAAPAAAPAGLTTRVCESYNTGDDLRQLSVCSSIWIDSTRGNYRGVVDMHTYRLANKQRVGDSVSQTITLGEAGLELVPDPAHFYNYGSDRPGTCLLNGPSGPASNCSVPNTASVTFYGVLAIGDPQKECNTVTGVGWRDDRGQAHVLQLGSKSHPQALPVEKRHNTVNPC
jgi:hypothetical protein